MATASPAALDLFIQRFTSQIDSGFGLISGDVQVILGTLVVISIALTAILWAIDETQNILASLVRKVLVVGFFAWLVGSWQTLSATVVNGFARLGLRAGGSGMATSDFQNAPTAAVDAGMVVVHQLMIYIGSLASQNLGMGVFAHFDVILIASVAAIGILLAFIILAIEIAITIIEFHLVTLIAFVTVPFGVLTQTSFLAERSIGYVVSVGLKMMALGVILGIGTNVFQTLTLSPEPTIGEECGLLLAALFLMMLALKVPSIAGALISGGPQLSSGSALMGAAGVAAGAAGVGLAARAAGGAVASGWAAGGEKIAAARAAAGAVSGRGGSPSGSGAASGGSAAASDVGHGGSTASAGAAEAASGSARASSSGGGFAQGARDFARAPVATAVAHGRSFAAQKFGGIANDGGGGGEGPPPPTSAQTVAGARARNPDGWASTARTSVAAAAAATESPGHGMTATPSRRDEDPERGA
jgi:type IV secretion system protein TrbL